MDERSARVVIGMDPHKRSVTIEVMTPHESIVGGGRYGTDADGYGRLLAYAPAVAGPGLGGRGLRRHWQACSRPAGRRR